MQEREKLKSRLGFILISAGCAIGIGNVWKFAYIAGQGGGGTFVILYLALFAYFGNPRYVNGICRRTCQPEESCKSL